MLVMATDHLCSSWWRYLMNVALAELYVFKLRIHLLYIEAGALWRDFDFWHMQFRTRLMIG